MKLTKNSWVPASEITSEEIHKKVVEKFVEAGFVQGSISGNFHNKGGWFGLGTVGGKYICWTDESEGLNQVHVKDLLEKSYPEEQQNTKERINVSLTPYEVFFLHNLVGQTASSVSPQICLMLSDSLSDYLEYDFDFIDYDTMYSEFGTINLWEIYHDLGKKWKVILETAQQSKQEKISELESKISSLQEELNILKQKEIK